MVARHVDERERLTRSAWERFAAGEDEIEGIPALILLSWQRSRDLYCVDPLQVSAPLATGPGGTSLRDGGVVAQLGGIASRLAQGIDGSLTTVTDGSGRVLAAWGAPGVRRRAAGVNLAPMFAWSECAAGTNGMGTVLGQVRPVSVRGAEHWCAPLHDWTCNAISVLDTVTGVPVAALSVSQWRREAGSSLPGRLDQAVSAIRRQLHAAAVGDGAELALAFEAADRAAAPGRAVLAADAAGRVVAANARARTVCDHLPAVPATDPADRPPVVSFRMREVVREAQRWIRSDPQWTRAVLLDVLGEDLAFAVRPVRARDECIGVVLVGVDGVDGEIPGGREVEPPPDPDRPFRMVGIRGNRLILIAPEEIRYAEADRHVVWLVTDRGRVRAAERGLAHVEDRLRRFGFLRVHRSYLVNVGRIREVERGIGPGTLTVSTRHHGREAVPVSRRHVPRLRAALGM
ncbi:LytTR family transcriptional regulator DNA-binding domain-containing protein [Pseudonocardia sp.]|uniref:LytTR family transcriptional regulator DNA-binding domain-containing protein n=1 Tax=Pseudonocardia sp. TaxID=60912 RepID=UPI00260CF528|nr:LytTR family transcriptional regulator DNA-binding domain-containing protein [Pseudonocardia sp.]